MNGEPGSRTPLRGFAFADGANAEFVYSKDEAVSLAKANKDTVPAIDPASEGKPQLNKLSKDDLEVVTLLMLTPTFVGKGHEPAIAAARYQAISTSSAQGASVSQPDTSTVTPPVEQALGTMPGEPSSPRVISHG